jgi:hypothetical protein
MVVPRGEGMRASPARHELVAAEDELYCPFELEENPSAARAQAEALAWAVEHGLVNDGPARVKLERACLGDLEGCAFPHAPAEMLALATIWVTLFCAIDDFVESSHLGTLALSGYLSKALAAFGGKAPARPDPLVRGFHDLGRQMRPLVGKASTRDFGRELEGLFTAYVWEELNRQNATDPDYAGYRIMRVTTIGLRPQFLISEALCTAGPPPAMARQALAELAQITCRVVGWANDIFTYDKELAAGEAHNLVAVLMKTEGLPVRHALLRARSLHDEEVCSFLRLQARLRGSADSDAGTEYRLAHLRHWMRGHLHWATRNGRYRPAIAA